MFAGYLRQSTQVDIVLGPVWDTSTGALKADLAYNAGGINCDVYRNGTKADVTLASGAGDGYFRAGSGEAQYILTLSTGNTDTIGRARITLSATGYYAAPIQYVVLDEAVYDVLFGTVAPSTLAAGAAMTLTSAYDAAKSAYTGTPPAASAIRAEIDTNSTQLAALIAAVVTNAAGTDVAADIIALKAVADAAATATNLAAAKTVVDGIAAGIAALADTNDIDDVISANASVVAILADTNELQTNQGDWATATGFMPATAKPTVGGYDTGQDPATLLLATPANKLATDGTGRVTVGSNADKSGYSGTATNMVAEPDNTGIGEIKTVTDNLATMYETDGLVKRLTANALEQAPTGGGGGGASVADILGADPSGYAPGTVGGDIAAAGAAADPLASPVPGEYGEGTAGAAIAGIADATAAAEATWARVAGFNPSSIVTQNPVSEKGVLSLYRGACYEAADGRALSWTRTGWPDLTGWTCELVFPAGTGLTFAGSATTDGDEQTVTVPLTRAQTLTLVTGSQSFSVRAVKRAGTPTAITHELPLLTGSARITAEV